MFKTTISFFLSLFLLTNFVIVPVVAERIEPTMAPRIVKLDPIEARIAVLRAEYAKKREERRLATYFDQQGAGI